MKSGYLLVGAMFIVAGVVQSCATDVSLGLGLEDAGTADSGQQVDLFTPPPDDSGSDASADAFVPPNPDVKMCVATECTYPLATCDDGKTARCNVDLLTDDNNCGACGHKCENYNPLSLGSKCTGGKCVAFCTSPALGDCNGIVDDGCETALSGDPKNCGSCGNKCPDGQPCNGGVCGCPSGWGVCNGQCTDIRNDSSNCGACGTTCSTASPCDGGTLPPNTRYGCGQGTCNKFACKQSNQRDCNGDLNLGCGSDGCEVDINTDPNNCGACGNKCAPGQFCASIDGADPQCLCGPGETACDKVDGKHCYVLDTDPNNCGACGVVCPTTPGADAVCRNGVCGFACPANTADCNGKWEDGCEVNLLTDMRNCGGCGVTCDTDAGQPCINGACLVQPCDAGVIVH